MLFLSHVEYKFSLGKNSQFFKFGAKLLQLILFSWFSSVFHLSDYVHFKIMTQVYQLFMPSLWL
jgi:hypothetical protein